MDVTGKPGRFRFLPYLFGGLFGVSLGLIIISGVFFYKSTRGTEAVRGASSQAVATSTAEPSTNPAAIDVTRRNAIVIATEKAAPAVVSIASKHTEVVQRYPFGSSITRDWLEQFFGMPPTYMREYSMLGSGVIIHEDGYILTNDHVVHNADVIEVTLSDGTTYEGKIVGAAPDYDLALVKVDGGRLPKAMLGDSDQLLVGEWAIAIGSPFGQLLNDTQPTVTVGVISAIHRDFKGGGQDGRIYKDMLQTDAAINPGNSGGPLVDSQGNVIGINTSIISASGGSLGMGFAIPINRGKWVLEEIQKYGRVREVWVGVTVMDITPQAAAALGLTQKQGLLVREIQLDSPADKAGLKPGDLITAVDGAKVTTALEANRMIFGSKIGERITFDVVRSTQTKRITVVLEEKPNET
jgi:serine protease Do